MLKWLAFAVLMFIIGCGPNCEVKNYFNFVKYIQTSDKDYFIKVNKNIFEECSEFLSLSEPEETDLGNEFYWFYLEYFFRVPKNITGNFNKNVVEIEFSYRHPSGFYFIDQGEMKKLQDNEFNYTTEYTVKSFDLPYAIGRQTTRWSENEFAFFIHPNPHQDDWEQITSPVGFDHSFQVLESSAQTLTGYQISNIFGITPLLTHSVFYYDGKHYLIGQNSESTFTIYRKEADGIDSVHVRFPIRGDVPVIKFTSMDYIHFDFNEHYQYYSQIPAFSDSTDTLNINWLEEWGYKSEFNFAKINSGRCFSPKNCEELPYFEGGVEGKRTLVPIYQWDYRSD